MSRSPPPPARSPGSSALTGRARRPCSTCCAGLSGRLRFDGAEVKGLRPHRLASLGIARTLQGVGLFRHLSVLENVMVGAEHVARAGFWSALAGLPAADRRERMLRARALEALD